MQFAQETKIVESRSTDTFRATTIFLVSKIHAYALKKINIRLLFNENIFPVYRAYFPIKQMKMTNASKKMHVSALVAVEGVSLSRKQLSRNPENLIEKKGTDVIIEVVTLSGGDEVIGPSRVQSYP